MGTRHLTMVISNGQTRIAQYGQWDGYPSGQGVKVFNFLKNADLEKFKTQVEKCKFVDEEKDKELDAFFESIGCKDGFMNMEQANEYKERYPQLSRDMGAEILSYVNEATDDTIWVRDSSDFAADSLFCEWAYVIDLDTNTLEIYKGFNTTELTPFDRFYKLSQAREGKYYPIRLANMFGFKHIPENLEEFVEILEPQDAED